MSRRERRRQQSLRDRDEHMWRLGRQLSDPLGDYRRFLERLRQTGFGSSDFLAIPVNLVELTASLIVSLLTGRRQPHATAAASSPAGSAAPSAAASAPSSPSARARAGRAWARSGGLSHQSPLEQLMSEPEDLGSFSDGAFRPLIAARLAVPGRGAAADAHAEHQTHDDDNNSGSGIGNDVDSGGQTASRRNAARRSGSSSAAPSAVPSPATKGKVTSKQQPPTPPSDSVGSPARSASLPGGATSHADLASQGDEAIRRFILRVISQTQLSCSTFIFALLLTYRLNQKERAERLTGSRVLSPAQQERRADIARYGGHIETFLASVICADKYLYDATYTDHDWVEFVDNRFSLHDINAMERVFLERLDYNLFVREADFDQFLTYLDLMLCIRQLSHWRSWGSLTYGDLLRLSYRLAPTSFLRHSRLAMPSALQPYDALVLLVSHLARIVVQYLAAVLAAVGVAAAAAAAARVLMPMWAEYASRQSALGASASQGRPAATPFTAGAVGDPGGGGG